MRWDLWWIKNLAICRFWRQILLRARYSCSNRTVPTLIYTSVISITIWAKLADKLTRKNFYWRQWAKHDSTCSSTIFQSMAKCHQKHLKEDCWILNTVSNLWNVESSDNKNRPSSYSCRPRREKVAGRRQAKTMREKAIQHLLGEQNCIHFGFWRTTPLI